jgi:hypothetical protein
VLGGLAGQFLPRLLDGYARHLALASPVSEGPVRAVLECAARSAKREMSRARSLVPGGSAGGDGGGGRAGSGGDSGALVQRLLGKGADIFPAARAS